MELREMTKEQLTEEFINALDYYLAVTGNFALPDSRTAKVRLQCVMDEIDKRKNLPVRFTTKKPR